MLHPIVRVGEVLIMKVSGVATREDWVRLLAETRALERQLAVTPHRITDASELENLVRGYLDIVDLVEDRSKEKFPNSFKSALVAPLPHQFGCARMFQSLNRNPQIDVQIFSTVEQALAWIAEPAESRREIV